MNEAVFLIDGVDFTEYVLSGGIKWSRNDIDASKSGRNKIGTMKRKRITTKRKLSVSCMNLTNTMMQTLNQALNHETIRVTYLDPIDGRTTRTFYGSTVEGTTLISQNGETIWQGTTFSITEV